MRGRARGKLGTCNQMLRMSQMPKGGCFAFSRLASHIRVLSKSGEKPALLRKPFRRNFRTTYDVPVGTAGFQLLAGTVSKLFSRNTESASGPVSGAELPGRFQVSLPRAVMLNESVEKYRAYGRLIRVRSKALRRSLAS